MDGPGIFATDVGGIDWAKGLVAIMDGPGPASGTSWEVCYAFVARIVRRHDSRHCQHGSRGRWWSLERPNVRGGRSGLDLGHRRRPRLRRYRGLLMLL